MENKTIVINLIAPPGSGKSTVASELFAKMKWDGYDVELVSEYAKELIWDERSETFKDELYLFSKQNHRMFRLNKKVRYIITDRPLILSIFYNSVYGDSSTDFNKIVAKAIGEYENLNIFLNRTKPYVTKGRNETEEESVEFGIRMKTMLDDLKVKYYEVDAIKNESTEIIKDLLHDFQQDLADRDKLQVDRMRYRTMKQDDMQIKRIEKEINKIKYMLEDNKTSDRMRYSFELQLESLETLLENAKSGTV